MRGLDGVRLVCALAFAVLCAACSSSSTPETVRNASLPAPVATAQPTPNPQDWPTYGFDAARTGDNPNETVLGSAAIASRGLVKLWQFGAAGIVIAQPVVASGVTIGTSTYDVAYVGDNLGNFYALDAASGKVLWQRSLQAATRTGCTDLPKQVFGISDAATIDRTSNRLYVVDGKANLYAFDLATGAAIDGWSGGIPLISDSDEHVYGGLTLDVARHTVYAGAGSLCDDLPYRGQVIAVDTAGIRVTGRFYPMGPNAYNTGGGVWGPGGVSLDPRGTGAVYAFTANSGVVAAATYPDSIVSLEPQLAGVIGAIDPDPTTEDYGFGSTPTIVPPSSGCPAYEAFGKDKNGILYAFENVDALANAAFVERVGIAPPEESGINVGTVAFSPATNMIYASNGADLSSAGISHGLLAFAIQPGCGIAPQPVWSNVNGPNGLEDDPPGNPSVANDVVYYTNGPSGNVDVFDAASGALLWTGTLGGASYTAPAIADGRVFVALWGSGAPGTGIGGPGGIVAFGLAPVPAASRKLPRR